MHHCHPEVAYHAASCTWTVAVGELFLMLGLGRSLGLCLEQLAVAEHDEARRRRHLHIAL